MTNHMSATKQCSCQGYNTLDFICVSVFYGGHNIVQLYELKITWNQDKLMKTKRQRQRLGSFQLPKGTSIHTNFTLTMEKGPISS